MRLFLIRHGETVDNVAGNYAGITDSALTNHGVLQANRLGAHFATLKTKVAQIFSSDLQRAFQTAEAIREAQDHPRPTETTRLPILREQDFGFYEGKAFFERPKEGNKSGKDAHLEAHRNQPGCRDVESKESMNRRMQLFVDSQLVDSLYAAEDHHAVVVVAHGIILNHLWRVILKRFSPGDVSVLPGVQAAERGFSLEYLGGWSNTGYLELEIKPKLEKIPDTPETDGSSTPTNTAELHTPAVLDDTSAVKPSAESLESTSKSPEVPQRPSTPPTAHPLSNSTPSKPLNMSLLVVDVNSKVHLKGLKKTRGGIGNLKHDSKQKTMDSFFKKRRLE